jgi:hypothetical protein
MNVARISAKQMNTQLGSAGEWNVNKVYNVQRQIVNGVNYKYTVEYLFSAQNKYTVRELGEKSTEDRMILIELKFSF